MDASNRPEVPPDLLATGLFSEVLEPLTETDTSSSRSSSPESVDFPEPLRKRARGDGKLRRLEQHKADGDALFPGFCVAKAINWHLHEARRCVTAFRGRVDQLCPNRLIVPKGTSPKQHLQLLERHGYLLIKVR